MRLEREKGHRNENKNWADQNQQPHSPAMSRVKIRTERPKRPNAIGRHFLACVCGYGTEFSTRARARAKTRAAECGNSAVIG